MESPVRFTESLTPLSVEYWETGGSIHGALADNLSADSLLILSARDMAINSRLNVRIFYANEYELDAIKLVANIVWKSTHAAEDWKGYKCELEFVQISEEDRPKLKDLLSSHVKLEEISGRGDIVPGEPSLTQASSPPLPNLDLTTGSTENCKFCENGKCLKTRAFCDLCRTIDESFLVQRANTIKKSRKHGFSPFTSVLSKLAENVRSTFRNY